MNTKVLLHIFLDQERGVFRRVFGGTAFNAGLNLGKKEGNQVSLEKLEIVHRRIRTSGKDPLLVTKL